MKKHSDCAYTIEDLCEAMKKDGSLKTIPGKSTVYRIMPSLVEEGLVKRFAGAQGRRFFYQMVCGARCDSHLHMKCSVCGKLYHMEDEESEALLQSVMQKHRFHVDEGKTILFGKCEKCCEEKDGQKEDRQR